MQMGLAHAAEDLRRGDVLDHADALPPGLGQGLPLRPHGQGDVCRVLLAQGELIPPQVDLNGVPEGGHLPHHNLGAGGEAHVHQPPLDRPPLAAHLEDDAPLAGKYLIQGLGGLFCLCAQLAPPPVSDW